MSIQRTTGRFVRVSASWCGVAAAAPSSLLPTPVCTILNNYYCMDMCVRTNEAVCSSVSVRPYAYNCVVLFIYPTVCLSLSVGVRVKARSVLCSCKCKTPCVWVLLCVCDVYICLPIWLYVRREQRTLNRITTSPDPVRTTHTVRGPRRRRMTWRSAARSHRLRPAVGEGDDGA